MTMAPSHLLSLLKFSTGLNPLSLVESEYFGDSFDKFSVALRGFREGSNYIRRSVSPVRLAPLDQQWPLVRLRSTGAFPRDGFGIPSGIGFRAAKVNPRDKRFHENRWGESFLGGSYGPHNYNKMMNPKDLSIRIQQRARYIRNEIFKDPEKLAAFRKYIGDLPPAPDQLTRNFKKIMFPY